MKLLSRVLFSSFSSFAVLVGGCTGKTLDGGSNTSSSSSSGAAANPPPATSATDESSSGAAAQDGIASTPLGGTVTGSNFTPTAVELRPDTKSSFWTLEIHNASTPCAKGRKLGDDIVIVDINGIGGEGSWPLDLGDASFQRGFYMATDNKQPLHDVSNNGRVRIDAKPGAVGTTVTGGLTVKGDTSELQGTFTATICEAR